MAPRTLYFSGLIAIAAAACASSSENGGAAGSDPSPTPSGTATTAPPPSSSSSSSSGSSGAPMTATGSLLFATGAPIVGASFTSGAQSGTTTSDGTFTYEVGANVTFTYGTQMLGGAPGAAILSPYQLAGSPTCEETPALNNLVALFEALDSDHDVTNGIALPTTPGAVPALGDLDAALRTFIGAFDGEAWKYLTMDTFLLTSALLRGQGLTSDGTDWYFSGRTGLEKTSATFSSEKTNALAIPITLALNGSDHIGDIDVLGGTIYAPVEDSKEYKSPKVVLYDAATLASGTIYDIPNTLQTKGVPWVAVDGPRGKVYLAEWDPTTQVNVFTLSTMAYEKSIPLVPPVGRIQGGKVYKGALYFSSDDANKTIYKVHLATGTVMTLFALGLTAQENEGLAFLARSDGSLMHTLTINASTTGSEMRHHQITREPLRWKACP